MSFNREEIQQLYRPFPLAAHSIREGFKTSSGQKVRWFVYLDRSAIQRRLDELFPGEWEFIPGERIQTATYISYTATLKIRGMARGFNGGDAQDVRRENGQKVLEFNENVEKGAMTDTFRRCASLWGLGDYLTDSVDIYTDAYANDDWDAKRKCETDSKKQFEAWNKANCGDVPVSGNGHNHTELPRSTDAWNMTELIEQTAFLYGNEFEQANSLKKHTSGDNPLIGNITTGAAVELLTRYKTKQRFDERKETITKEGLDEFILSALDMSLSDWRKSVKPMSEAWKCLQDAMALRFPETDIPF